MIEGLLIVLMVLSFLTLGSLLVVVLRSKATDASPLLAKLNVIEKWQEQFERRINDALTLHRQEASGNSRGMREEIQLSLRNATDSLVQSIKGISTAQQQRLEDLATQFVVLRQATDSTASQIRLELTESIHRMKESQDSRLAENAGQLQQQFELFETRLSEFDKANHDSAAHARAELSAGLNDLRESLQKQTSNTLSFQKQQFDSFAAQLGVLTDKTEKKSDDLRTTVERKLMELQLDNTAKLEEMRRTVDEKLQGTLEKRLGESFKQVSDRLEQVHKGLGEMQTLATGVGDLKRVLLNVKTRGTWGEIQLGNLLEQILTSEQYGRNVRVKPNESSTVEYAIKLPGPEDEKGKVVWLPIDAKFPKEDYERLVDASERGDASAVEQAAKDLDARIRAEARDIRDRYLSPPHTTDFGLLFLPTEGLYAEVLRRPGLADSLQREQRVVVVGPTTLAALLNSLQIGFKTLAIQKRSAEVWKVLGAIKTQFGKFGDLLAKVKNKLDETGDTIDEAVSRTRQIEKKLRKVEALPADEASALIPDTHSLDAEAEEVTELVE